MHVPAKRTLAIGAVVVAAAAGGGAAVAATTNGSSPNDFLDSVAKHLGISRQKLDDATKAAALDQVDAQLKAGQITQAQADQLKQRIQNGDIPPLVFGRRGFGPGGPGVPGVPGGMGVLKAGIGDAFSAAAKYLGLSESDLRTKLGNGQSLAEIAKAQGKSPSGLEDAIVAAQKSALDQAVKDKRLTQAQADKVLSVLKAHADDLVNGTPGAGPRFRGRFHGGGPRFFFGP
jgi:hypothetical protein